MKPAIKLKRQNREAMMHMTRNLAFWKNNYSMKPSDRVSYFVGIQSKCFAFYPGQIYTDICIEMFEAKWA